MMAATGVDKDRPRAMTSTTYLGLLLVGIQVLGFVAAIHAVLTVRTAQGAIAWATSLVFMPYLTLLPYLVFGRSRFDAYIERGARPTARCTWRPPSWTGVPGSRRPWRPARSAATRGSRRWCG